ncbi:MAG TPA: hypothetical protein DEF18_12580 [Muricauda sp.]|uniref:DUF3592 domain-containing protein n=1 Tax=Flagellimonas aurea TaxID=2915619 RepID=A0ABS3G284_9FLAO|nr:hypothetical protein [Allomuricauda aurea]MBC73698.1 hypothetical protein [Allomuricauda sp.]MBO0353524.1 hypothetical protein [Allomuricauda aurea]HBU78930.1 hypothetical protein [Allomuricauda sp.]|tara:strand:- start:89 stop:481 length:393 start_codon:yes stop_codon:yes gene_type:complete
MNYRKILDFIKNEQKSGKVFVGLISVIILIGIGKQYWEQKQIFEDRGTTTGIITEYLEAGWQYDALLYEYTVNGKKYQNSVGVSRNTDKKAGEKLKMKFKVYYAKSEPRLSVINLAELEEYKTYVEFFDF